METIEKMTLDELKHLILDLMEERRIAYLFGELDMDEANLGLEDEPDNRTLVQVLDSVARNRWTPPEGSPTPSEMLRQSRDDN